MHLFIQAHSLKWNTKEERRYAKVRYAWSTFETWNRRFRPTPARRRRNGTARGTRGHQGGIGTDWQTSATSVGCGLPYNCLTGAPLGVAEGSVRVTGAPFYKGLTGGSVPPYNWLGLPKGWLVGSVITATTCHLPTQITLRLTFPVQLTTMMRILSVVALMIGAATAQTTGTLSSTTYDGAGCVTRATECGADNVNLPDPATCGDSCDCAAEDVTDTPRFVVHWTSGECVTCSTADGTTECKWPYVDTSDDMYSALAAHGADLAYAKITCANGVATVEHFSDAGCTAANKVSNGDVTAAFQAYYAGRFAYSTDFERAIVACFSVDFNMMSGVNIQGSHCDEVQSFAVDEVRLASPACSPDPPVL